MRFIGYIVVMRIIHRFVKWRLVAKLFLSLVSWRPQIWNEFFTLPALLFELCVQLTTCFPPFHFYPYVFRCCAKKNPVPHHVESSHLFLHHIPVACMPVLKLHPLWGGHTLLKCLTKDSLCCKVLIKLILWISSFFLIISVKYSETLATLD